MEQTTLSSKINSLPSDLKSEVNNFVDFLLSRKNKKQNKSKPRFGSAKSKIQISPDFDDPLEDFKNYI